MSQSLLRRLLVLFLAGALGSTPLAAQTQTESPAGAEPGAELTVYVMTMGPGSLVWERFGHNAIWVHDALHGTDEAYNFGLFDFAQENFLLRFVQGRMLYWMEGFDAYRTAEHYRHDDRSVWVQELNLTPRERLELRDFLEWNEQPENRYYRYDYYRDNCSTRVRDVIDRVLGGRLREQTTGEPTGASYRSHTRRLTSNDALVYTGLMLGLGQPVDRPIDAWEEMFLPLKLREHLRDVTVRDPDGREVPLVLAEHTLYESTRPPVPEAPPAWLPGYLLVGLVLGAALVLLGRAAPRSRLARHGFAGLAGAWTLLVGMGGAILAGLWLLTDHAAAYRNENLLQADPLALALVLLVPALAYGAAWAARPARILALAVAGLSVLGFALQVLPGLDQVNGEVIALFLPAHLGLAWAVHRLSRGPAGSETTTQAEARSPEQTPAR